MRFIQRYEIHCSVPHSPKFPVYPHGWSLRGTAVPKLFPTQRTADGTEIDSLTYRYSVGEYGLTRNRLCHVNDGVDETAFDDDIDDMGPFDDNPSAINVNNNSPSTALSARSYDELGRLIRDAQEGIAAIDWRNDGKIRAIINDSESIGRLPDRPAPPQGRLIEVRNPLLHENVTCPVTPA